MAETEAIHHAGAVVLDHDIAPLGELGRHGCPRGGGEVDADVALAGVLLDEVGGESVHLRGGEAGQIAGGRFDLDHLGPEVAEHPGGVRAGQHPGEVENANPRQWLGHSRRKVSDDSPTSWTFSVSVAP